MAGPVGTFETLALELGQALQPLHGLLDTQFFARLGVPLPRAIAADAALLARLQEAGAKASELAPQTANLASAIGSGDTVRIVAAAAPLIATIAQLTAKLGAVGTALDAAAAALPPAEKAALQDLAAKLAERTLEYLGVGYLNAKMPTLTSTLALLGIIDIEAQPAPGMEVVRSVLRQVPRRLRLDHLSDLFTKPDQYFQQAFQWGAPGFDGQELLLRVQALLESMGVPAAVYERTGQPPVLEAFVFSAEADPSVSPPGLLFELGLPGAATFDRGVDFSPLWKGSVHAQAEFAAGLAVKLRPPFDVSAQPPSGNVALKLLLGLQAQGTQAAPLTLFGATGGTRLQARAIGGSLGIDANLGPSGGAVQPALRFQIDDGKLVIDFSQGDGFVQKVLSGVHVEAPFTLAADWDPKAGLRLAGQGGVEIFVPLHLDLAVVEVNGLYFVVGLSSAGAFTLGLATRLTARLGPLTGVVDRIGMDADLSFPHGGGKLGLADIGFRFRPPRGVGLSLDVGAVQGGGFLDFDPARGEYAGMLELSLFGVVTIKAFGLISTKMPDGQPGFSLLVIMSVEFGTGIQLGFGFTLLGVGGLLGLNRTMNLDALLAAVRTGGLNSVLFPQNIVANAPRIISDLRAFFPPLEGRFLIGPMAKLGWGTPALVTASLGVIIEIPGNVALVGVLKVVLPAEDAAILRLQVAFVGALEFDKQRLYFFASLFDSRIAYITLDGDMGLLVAWGADANFVVSAGGFHPQFQPPPLPFPSLHRIALDLLSTPTARVHVEGYFAVTTNTAQFGASVDVFFGLSSINAQGHLGFDALFQFSPFHFVITITASFSVKVFGTGLFSVHIHGLLEGPAPWHIKGHGGISLLFWDIDVDFETTWGDDRNSVLPPVAVLPLLQAELNKLDAWRALPPPGAGLFVSLRQMPPEEAALILHPVGVLEISQRALPLGITLAKVGSQKPSDVGRLSVAVTSSALARVGDATEPFAPAQFQEFSDADKLSRPAFAPQVSGLKLSASGADVRSSRMVRRVVRYEQIILDGSAKRAARRFSAFVASLFQHFMRGNAVARASVSQASQAHLQPFADTIAVLPDTYTVAFQATNRPYAADTASFTSEASAREYLNRTAATDRALAGTLHVIPTTEMAA